MIYQGITQQTRRRTQDTRSYVVMERAFSDAELDRIRDMGANTPMMSGEARDLNIRRSAVSYHEPDGSNDWIFQKLNQAIINANAQFYGFDLNGYDYFQYARYTAKDEGHYDWHTDMEMDTIQQRDSIETRKLSLSVLLNDDFEGGIFDISLSHANAAHPIHLQRGSIVFFPSWIMHRVTKVTSGVRESLVVWVTGPKFR